MSSIQFQLMFHFSFLLFKIKFKFYLSLLTEPQWRGRRATNGSGCRLQAPGLEQALFLAA